MLRLSLPAFVRNSFVADACAGFCEGAIQGLVQAFG